MHGTIHLLRGARRLHADSGDLDGDRPKAHKAIEEVIRAVLRARHEHAPAEERLDVEPRHAVALLDDLADNDHSRAGLLGRLHVCGHVLQSRHYRTLLQGRPTAGDDHRRLSAAAGTDEGLGDRRRRVGTIRHDDGDAIASE